MKLSSKGICSTDPANCRCHGSETVITADHVGPISLGFAHTPYFVPLCSPCNSSKNNRMSLADVKRLIVLEQRGVTVVSWQAKFSGTPVKIKFEATSTRCFFRSYCGLTSIITS